MKFDFSSKSLGLLIGVSTYTDDPQNLGLKAPSSRGKTWVAENVVDYLPSEDVWFLGGLSPTALVHDHARLEHAETGQELDEDWVSLQMDGWDEENPEPGTRRERRQHKKERMKALRGFKKEWREVPKKYVVDLSGKLLLFLEAPHMETFARLRPILSHDRWEITYKFTDRSPKKSLATRTVTLRGWPSTIFCTTDLAWMEDLATRSFTATPSAKKEKLVAAVDLIGEKVSKPWLYEDDKRQIFRTYIVELKEALKNWIPVIPFGKELARATPKIICRDMRDFKHICMLVKIMALFHFYTRPKVVSENRKYLLSTMQDFLHVMDIWRDVEATTRTGLSGEELYAYSCLLELEREYGPGEGEKTPDFGVPLKWIVEKYNEENNQTISSKTAYKYFENLLRVGIVDKNRDPNDKKRNLYRSLGEAKDPISEAWENALPFFSQEDLKKWFLSLGRHSPQNQVKVITYFEGELEHHKIQVSGDGETLDNSELIEKLFRGEYHVEPRKPKKESKKQKRTKTFSHRSDIQQKSPPRTGPDVFISKSNDLGEFAQDVRRILTNAGGEMGDLLFLKTMKEQGYHPKDVWNLLQPLVDRGLITRGKMSIKLEEGWN